MRILIADDNEYVRRGARSILASESQWEICGEAKDGPEAIKSAAELLPDFILLDVSMPGLSGLEVARILRDKVPLTKILVMSQHDPAVLLPRAMEAGAHACIDKSRLATDLLPTIKRVQAAQQPFAPQKP
jgi:DNA-binding NarL/FixJ family response regulator